jgi:hypothetical protein
MPDLSIGSVAFVISEDHRNHPPISGPDAEQITADFTDFLKYSLKQYDLDRIVTITNVEHSLGCVTIVVSFAMITAAAGAGGLAAAKFLKDYPKIREGLVRLVDDIKGRTVWIKRLFNKKSTLSPPKELTRTDNAQISEVKQIAIEKMNKQIDLIPPEHFEYWTAGQEFTLLNEKGDFYKLTISVKAECLHAPDPPKSPRAAKKTPKKKK